jgi:hypothetical protein
MSTLRFETLSPKHKHHFEKEYIKSGSYSDTSLTTLLYWWSLDDPAKICVVNDNICIRSRYISNNMKVSAYSLFGVNNVDDTFYQIFDLQRKKGYEIGAHFIPEYTVENISNLDDFIVVENTNSAEYIISVDDHALFPGKAFKTFRKKKNRIEKILIEDSLRLERVIVDEDNYKFLTRALLKLGASAKNDEEKIEDRAIKKLLSLYKHEEIICYTLLFQNQLIAIATFKSLNEHTINACHLRYDESFPDIFSYFFHLIAKDLKVRSPYNYINIEQDLGIEGLREHKRRMRPVKKLRKYSVYPNSKI